MRKRILGIIPARAGSKRIQGKNKKLLGGKELVHYILEAGTDSERISTLVVSSDDDDVLQIASQYKGVIALKRPIEIAGDTSPAIDYVRHTIDTLQQRFDAVVILQPSSPFTEASDIDATIDLLWNEGVDCSVSVMPVDHAFHPMKMKLIDAGILIPYVEEEKGKMAAHELENVYVRNCSVYASKWETIQSGVIIGDRCAPYIMSRERSLDINDPIDFEFAEFLMQKYVRQAR